MKGFTCVLCEVSIKGIEEAIAAGWTPSFWSNNEEYGSVCPHCTAKYLQQDDSGDMEIKPIFEKTFMDSASSKRYDEPLAKIESVKCLYPDRELIKKLRGKFLEYTIDSMAGDEIIDLVNHQHQLIADLDQEIENLKIDLQSHYDDF